MVTTLSVALREVNSTEFNMSTKRESSSLGKKPLSTKSLQLSRKSSRSLRLESRGGVSSDLSEIRICMHIYFFFKWNYHRKTLLTLFRETTFNSDGRRSPEVFRENVAYHKVFPNSYCPCKRTNAATRSPDRNRNVHFSVYGDTATIVAFRMFSKEL